MKWPRSVLGYDAQTLEMILPPEESAEKIVTGFFVKRSARKAAAGKQPTSEGTVNPLGKCRY
jgi:hypothetical protein